MLRLPEAAFRDGCSVSTAHYEQLRQIIWRLLTSEFWIRLPRVVYEIKTNNHKAMLRIWVLSLPMRR
jgi:hypothetical protein